MATVPWVQDFVRTSTSAVNQYAHNSPLFMQHAVRAAAVADRAMQLGLHGPGAAAVATLLAR